MLTSAVRLQSRRFQSAPTLSASFTTSRPIQNPQPLQKSDFDEITGILHNAAATIPPRPSYSAKSGHTPLKDRMLWKPFELNRPITPHKMTFKAREQKPLPPKKRPVLGPASRESRFQDVFHQLEIDPRKEAQNPTLLGAFVSEMGKIQGRNVTNLTTKNQRKLGKAIRRAKMMGVMPILSRPGPAWFHPRFHS